MAQASDREQPQCLVCFRLLPHQFQGFEICPMCLYKQRVSQANQRHARPPSYRSPYAQLERESHGDNESAVFG